MPISTRFNKYWNTAFPGSWYFMIMIFHDSLLHVVFDGYISLSFYYVILDPTLVSSHDRVGSWKQITWEWQLFSKQPSKPPSTLPHLQIVQNQSQELLMRDLAEKFALPSCITEVCFGGIKPHLATCKQPLSRSLSLSLPHSHQNVTDNWMQFYCNVDCAPFMSDDCTSDPCRHKAWLSQST